MKKAIAFALVIVAMLPAFMCIPTDAQDVDYVTPPSADTVIQINMTNLKSNDPVQTVTYNHESTADEYFMSYLVSSAQAGRHGYSFTERHCKPSWISWEASNVAGNYEASWLTVSIAPALQQVSHDTHGDYWIYFDCTSPDMFSTSRDTFLIKIHLDISWAGTVIVQDDVYHTYALTFDSLGGSVSQTYYYQVLADSDTGIHYFDTTVATPTKDGYRFKGWSTVNGDNQPNDVSDDFPLIAANADSINSSDPRNIVYSKTVFAIWQESAYDELPDPLREVVSLLSNPAVLAIVFILVIVTAYVVRVRRLGMWGMR